MTASLELVPARPLLVPRPRDPPGAAAGRPGDRRRRRGRPRWRRRWPSGSATPGWSRPSLPRDGADQGIPLPGTWLPGEHARAGRHVGAPAGELLFEHGGRRRLATGPHPDRLHAPADGRVARGGAGVALVLEIDGPGLAATELLGEPHAGRLVVLPEDSDPRLALDVALAGSRRGPARPRRRRGAGPGAGDGDPRRGRRLARRARPARPRRRRRPASRPACTAWRPSACSCSAGTSAVRSPRAVRSVARGGRRRAWSAWSAIRRSCSSRRTSSCPCRSRTASWSAGGPEAGREGRWLGPGGLRRVRGGHHRRDRARRPRRRPDGRAPDRGAGAVRRRRRQRVGSADDRRPAGAPAARARPRRHARRSASAWARRGGRRRDRAQRAAGRRQDRARPWHRPGPRRRRPGHLADVRPHRRARGAPAALPRRRLSPRRPRGRARRRAPRRAARRGRHGRRVGRAPRDRAARRSAGDPARRVRRRPADDRLPGDRRRATPGCSGRWRDGGGARRAPARDRHRDVADRARPRDAPTGRCSPPTRGRPATATSRSCCRASRRSSPAGGLGSAGACRRGRDRRRDGPGRVHRAAGRAGDREGARGRVRPAAASRSGAAPRSSPRRRRRIRRSTRRAWCCCCPPARPAATSSPAAGTRLVIGADLPDLAAGAVLVAVDLAGARPGCGARARRGRDRPAPGRAPPAGRGPARGG